MIFPLTTLPANAATSAKSTFAYIGAMPNPVGVGQAAMLHVGIPDPLSTYTDGFTDLTVIVTKPDNTTETIGPYRTDSTGGTGVIYTPTMVGTYHLKTHFPAQWFNITATNSNTYYKESYSPELALIVQEDPIPYYSRRSTSNRILDTPHKPATQRMVQPYQETGLCQPQYYQLTTCTQQTTMRPRKRPRTLDKTSRRHNKRSSRRH